VQGFVSCGYVSFVWLRFWMRCGLRHYPPSRLKMFFPKYSPCFAYARQGLLFCLRKIDRYATIASVRFMDATRDEIHFRGFFAFISIIPICSWVRGIFLRVCSCLSTPAQINHRCDVQFCILVRAVLLRLYHGCGVMRLTLCYYGS
jgi:hypothetical protein